LRVVDSGVGIRPAELERVFEMFSRIRRQGAASEPGLGIGLALARRLAEMHGGTLAVSSDGEDRGATFSLRIPTTESADEPVAPAKALSSAKAARPLSIVVVEDDNDAGDVLLEWLKDLGHRVMVARTGKAGLEAIRDRRPNVVICDIGLPDISGLDVCRNVRSFTAETQPIMVALTGWGRNDDRRLSKEAGFDLHLVKPVAADALTSVLQSASESLLLRPAI
jgi:CheY-like chemotaxis protein